MSIDNTEGTNPAGIGAGEAEGREIDTAKVIESIVNAAVAQQASSGCGCGGSCGCGGKGSRDPRFVDFSDGRSDLGLRGI